MSLQMKGQPDKAADGKSMRNYGFELKQNGDILLNGVVINPKMAPAGAGQSKPLSPHMTPLMPASPPQP
jgi:hypothetical protein